MPEQNYSYMQTTFIQILFQSHLKTVYEIYYIRFSLNKTANKSSSRAFLLPRREREGPCASRLLRHLRVHLVVTAGRRRAPLGVLALRGGRRSAALLLAANWAVNISTPSMITGRAVRLLGGN